MSRTLLFTAGLILSVSTAQLLAQDLQSTRPLPPPPVISNALISESWDAYKARFIQGDGRVVDPKAKGISTSEGQAYAMLRALWMNDQHTFLKVYQWACNNLNAQIRGDRLFAWKWGQAPDGAWHVLDSNVASDADQIIAYSLLIAGERWKHPAYTRDGQALLADIWRVLTRNIAGQRFILPGNWTPTEGPIRLNPSYYLPFAYRVFARFDPKHPWSTLVDTSYRVFQACRSPLGLPTDWCHLDSQSAHISINTDGMDPSGDFGFEAFRVLWTLEAESRWFQEGRAHTLLQETQWLRRYLAIRGTLPSVITVDGIPRRMEPYLGLYGAWFPTLASQSAMEATALYESVIAPAFNQGLFQSGEDYYLHNWLWFGLAMQSVLPPPLPMD